MPLKGIKGTNRERQICSKGLHPMYVVPEDPNVMHTADGDRCRLCWMLADAVRRERRKQATALRAAARARIKQTKVALGRPPAAAMKVVPEGSQDETTDISDMNEMKAQILRRQVKFLKDNPQESQDNLLLFEHKLRVWAARHRT